MLERVKILNFKSILDEEIQLGSFNVFIGQNGCGKTNVLEAVGMLAAGVSGRLTVEDLYNRGIRMGRPSLMASSFPGAGESPPLELSGATVLPSGPNSFTFGLVPKDPAAYGGSWIPRNTTAPDDEFSKLFPAFIERVGGKSPDELSATDRRALDLMVGFLAKQAETDQFIAPYAIYAPATNTLRGLETTSRRDPLGLYGENLDVTLSTFPKEDLDRLKELVHIIDWVDDLQFDEGDRGKFDGLKLGRSVSRLYFTDKYMRPDNRTFSAENANEGILHVLFHLALFLSAKTPSIFAIDNLDTSLNPGMCRRLTKVLAELAVERKKQALVTTHNPAILDGLNLNDDAQRLFVVYRNDDGHTKVKRVRMKPDAAPGLKLSELWLRGHLGALPLDF